jgi:hypothetical protein
MDGERLLRVLVELAAQPEPRTRALCLVSVRVVGTDGAGVTLMMEGASGPLCSSDAVSARVEELQYTLGEGPCIDSHRIGAPVSEPDMAAAGAARWPTFGGQAVAAGVGAVFAFPIRIGAVRMGAVTFYGARAGPLGDERLADALTMADVVAQEIVVAQSGAAAGALSDDFAAVGTYRAEIHQASGMVSIQLDVPVSDALVRLRAHAFSTGRPLRAIAAEVVARRLRLEP